MNGPVNTIYREGATAIKLALSINLLASMALSVPVIAQAELDQNSLLPPEVVPIQQSAVNTVSQSQVNSNSQPLQSSASVPGLVANPNNVAASPQSAQDMRNQVYSQLMGQGNYPQLSNQNSVWTNQGQTTQPMGQSTKGLGQYNPAAGQYSQAPGQYNPAAGQYSQAPGQYNPAAGQYSQAPGQYNQAPGQSAQPLGQNGQPLVQANQSIGQSNWMTPEQNNAMANAMPAQTQTLTGGVQNASAATPMQNGYGYPHAVSTMSGLGMTAFGLGMSRGSGSLYGVGLMGATSLFGAALRNGFHF